MSTVAVPSDADITAAAQERYAKRRQKLIDRGLTDPFPPTWDELGDAERTDELNRMRAAAVAGPRVAKALGLRTYSLTVEVPEPGKIVMYQGWPAIVTATRDSTTQYLLPSRAQQVLPKLRDELCVHLHVMSAVGPYPAHAVDHGSDGWQWPHEAQEECRRAQERDDGLLLGVPA